MAEQRARRRWRSVAVALLLIGAATAATAWWLQRQATHTAAELLLRAAAATPALPEVPRWPLTASANVRPDAEAFPFAPERPTLIVLVHGMSPSPLVDERVGTHAYARHYWGHAYLRALLGSDALYDAAGRTLTVEGWEASAASGDAGVDGLVFPAPPDQDPSWAALLVTRDASLGLGAQTHATAWQVHDALTRFDERSGARAQLVLIGHSMGGLVGRHLLVNPPVDDGPFGVDAVTRERIDALRDRVLYLVTLGTPHEGSQAADRGMLLREVRRLALDEFVRPNAIVRDWLLPLAEEASPYLRIDDEATQHLRRDVWDRLNDPRDGLLAPHRTRRSDGSLVPVYALAARAPGGHFFRDPLVSERIELELALWHAEHLGLDPESYLEYTLQMLLADPAMHGIGLPERGWGDAAAHPADAAVLDQVTRVVTAPRSVTIGPSDARVSLEVAARVDYLRGPQATEVATRGAVERLWCLLARCGDEAPLPLDVGSVDDLDLSALDDPSVAQLRELLLERDPDASAGVPSVAAGAVGDGGIDADGVVPVDSALGLLMGGGSTPYLAAGTSWRVGDASVEGSWYRPDLEDPSTELPWTYLHHIDLQYEPSVARWLADELLGSAGPLPGPFPRSAWP